MKGLSKKIKDKLKRLLLMIILGIFLMILDQYAVESTFIIIVKIILCIGILAITMKLLFDQRKDSEEDLE